MHTSKPLGTTAFRPSPARRWARAALTLGAVGLFLQGTIAQVGPDHPDFFRVVPAGQESRLSDVPAAKRQRNVWLNLDLLRDGSNPGGQVDGLTFPLFKDTVVSGSIQRAEAAYGGGTILQLDIAQDRHGHASLSIVGDSMTGTFRVNDRLYKVHPVGDGQHTVTEVDELRLPPCGTPNAAHGGTRGVVGAPMAATTSEVLDMLVVYSDDARASYGFDGILSLINLAVFETNQGYAQSDVNLRVNLVLAREVAFNESGSLSTWVSQLRNVDGVIDEVHTWRDEYGADAVCMITASGAGFCGQAYNVMTVLSSAGANDAFNVTSAGCATGNYTFGHELGHSLGCQHDRANTSGSALYPYCFGYRTASQTYRTIMAYAPGTRLNIWSNPAKRAPNGQVLGAANSEENWRVLNNVVATASAWRSHRNSGHDLKTTFKSNNGASGNMFNVQAKDDIEITAIDINTSAATSTAVSARIWYRHGTFTRATSTAAGWCLIGTATGTASGQNLPTRLITRGRATFRAGNTYGVYVEYLGSGNLRYTNGSPKVYENNHIKLTTGVGKAAGFAGQVFPDRIWNGRLRYRGGTGTESLTTTFTGTNFFAGNMFSVTPSKHLTINSFDVNVSGSGYVSVDVWRRVGSYVGNEGNASGWTFMGSEFKAQAAGAGLPTRITVGDIDLNAGTTYSFYVLLSSYVSGSQVLQYTTASTNYSNSDLTIAAGVGTDEFAFSGNTFSPRVWNGRINYTLKGTLSPFGAGCLGTNGVPTHTASGSPTLGSSVTYSLTRGPAGGVAYLTLGNSRTNWLGLLLPVGLGIINAPGCNIYVDHDVVLGPFALSRTGATSLNVNIADVCGLIGVHLYTQYLVFDPGANGLGITSSNAVDALLSH